MFIARGKVGPFRIDAEVLAGADGMVAVRTLLPRRGRRGPGHRQAGSYQFRRAKKE